ncbi:hypothetical protein AB6E50_17070 [Vibrio cyclitrophicus]
MHKRKGELYDNKQINVIDPNELPTTLRLAFEEFLAGSYAPHPIYAYQHDFERFILLIEQGHIKIKEC